jgi:hypothetical protein
VRRLLRCQLARQRACAERRPWRPRARSPERALVLLAPQVVCTIGPATCERDSLFALADAGMNVARCVWRAATARARTAPLATAGHALRSRRAPAPPRLRACTRHTRLHRRRRVSRPSPCCLRRWAPLRCQRIQTLGGCFDARCRWHAAAASTSATASLRGTRASSRWSRSTTRWAAAPWL